MFKKFSTNDIRVYWKIRNLICIQEPIYISGHYYGIYHAIIDFNIVNYGEIGAYILVTIEARYRGEDVIELIKYLKEGAFFYSVTRYGHFKVPSHTGIQESLSFSFLSNRPDPYLDIKVTDVIPVFQDY